MSVLGKEFKYWKVKVVVIVQKLSDIPYSYFSIISLLDKVKSIVHRSIRLAFQILKDSLYNKRGNQLIHYYRSICHLMAGINLNSILNAIIFLLCQLTQYMGQKNL